MSDLHDDLEEGEEMVSPAQIGLMLLDWTDPSKTVYVFLLNERSQSNSASGIFIRGSGEAGVDEMSVHIDVAIDIIKELFVKEMESESLLTTSRFCAFADRAVIEDRKKVLVQLLPKLYIPTEIDDDKLRTLILLTSNLRRVSFLSTDGNTCAHLSEPFY